MIVDYFNRGFFAFSLPSFCNFSSSSFRMSSRSSNRPSFVLTTDNNTKLYVNKTAFQAKSDHPRTSEFSNAHLTFLLLWPWPWHVTWPRYYEHAPAYMTCVLLTLLAHLNLSLTAHFSLLFMAAWNSTVQSYPALPICSLSAIWVLYKLYIVLHCTQN